MLVINRGFRVIINQHKLCAINKVGLPLGCSNQSEMVGKHELQEKMVKGKQIPN